MLTTCRSSLPGLCRYSCVLTESSELRSTESGHACEHICYFSSTFLSGVSSFNALCLLLSFFSPVLLSHADTTHWPNVVLMYVRCDQLNQQVKNRRGGRWSHDIQHDVGPGRESSCSCFGPVVAVTLLFAKYQHAFVAKLQSAAVSGHFKVKEQQDEKEPEESWKWPFVLIFCTVRIIWYHPHFALTLQHEAGSDFQW